MENWYNTLQYLIENPSGKIGNSLTEQI